MRKVLLIGMILLLLPVLAFGENNENVQYKFIKGKGIEVCEAYYKNLIDNPADDIRCERDFNPKLKGFKKTNWVKLNLVENKEIVRKIRKFLNYGDQFAQDTAEDKTTKLVVGVGDAMYFSKIDIDNDGKSKNVILYSEGGCMRNFIFRKLLLVMLDDNTIIDIKKTEPLLQNIPDADIKAKAQSTDYHIYDAFSYKTRIYFDKWHVDTSELHDITVSKILNNKADVICKYKCIINRKGDGSN